MVGREGTFEHVGVGEEGVEVVDCADEVVEVHAAELLNPGLAVLRDDAKRGEQWRGRAVAEESSRARRAVG